MPAHAWRVEDMAFEFDKAHGAKAQAPQCASGMEQVEMRSDGGHADGSRHGETIFEQRPVKAFSIEGDEDMALGKAGGEFREQGVLFGEVAEKHLFYLEAAGVPPGKADEEGVSAGAAGKACGFGVEEQPFLGIFEGGTRAPRDGLFAGARKELKSRG